MSNKKESSNVYNVLAFHFDGQDTAELLVKEIGSSGILDDYVILAKVIVSQDENGKVHFQETGHGGLGAVIGGAAGGLLSLLGGPVGFLAWVVGGAVLGGMAGKYLGRPFKAGDLKEVAASLVPDSSAFMILVEDIYSEAIIDSLSDVNANVVTLTVGDELSGELSQFLAADVTVEDVTDGDSADDKNDDE